MKMNVFVSRPTHLPDGVLQVFYRRLEDRNLAHRTLGARNQTLRNPMDAICEMISACQGAVVLGYPGLLDRSATRAARTTEWNHIEGGIAYAHGLPLLVIRDKTASGGLFDPGAANVLVHEVDLLHLATRRSGWSSIL